MHQNILGEEIIGIRQHYLRFDIRKTWEIQDQAGFKYDTTLAFPDQAGFKNGMCLPFLTFDPQSLKQNKLVEIPLVIMDAALSGYMQLSLKQSWELIQKLLDTVRELQGVITILWHNDRFDALTHPKSAALYEKILQYGQGTNAWMTSGENIYKHWKQND